LHYFEPRQGEMALFDARSGQQVRRMAARRSGRGFLQFVPMQGSTVRDTTTATFRRQYQFQRRASI
jgi:hypothetical protein